MPGSSLFAVHQAVRDLLLADAGAGGFATRVGSRIYDGVPQDPVFPYAVVRPVTEGRFDTYGVAGKDALFALDYFSRYAGWTEAYDLHNRALVVLDGAALALTGWTAVYLRFDLVTEAGLDPDGVTRHLVAQFRAVVQPA